MSDSSHSDRDDVNRGSNIVFAIDAAHNRNQTDTAIIADITKDEVWVTADIEATVELDAWR